MFNVVRWSFCLLLVSGLFASAATQAAELRAGAATSNITPKLGQDIIGGFVPFPAKHVHDQLHVRCLVLDDGTKKLALVVCDLLGIHRIVSDEARRLIAEQSQIPPECVLISATHTHSACSALGSKRYEADQMPDDYQAFVAKRIADAVQCAVNELRPAELAFGTAEAPEHVFNRRWSMQPGTMPENPFGGIDLVKMNPPAGSPNLVAPAGPTDPTISFLSVREPGGKSIGLYAAYSLHYVGGVGPGHISADYFAEFCSELTKLQHAEDQEPAFVPMLANGTSGDINNINFREPRPRQEPYAQMKYVAHDVAAKVHAALAKVKYESNISLDARYTELDVMWRHPDEELLKWAKATIAKGPQKQGDLSYIYAERTLRQAETPEKAAIPLQVLRIGEVYIGTMPCEVFCEIGLEFKSRAGQMRPAFLVSIAHGYFGYLPTPKQHQLGGYETWMGTNRLEKEASVKMLDRLLQMVGELEQ